MILYHVLLDRFPSLEAARTNSANELFVCIGQRSYLFPGHLLVRDPVAAKVHDKVLDEILRRMGISWAELALEAGALQRSRGCRRRWHG